MGKTSTREEREGMPPKRGGSFPSHSSPSSSSSSSSDFEFTVSLSPSSRRSPSNLCPADELFYKGQLLPLHLSPRISMVRTLLLASSSTSSSDTNTTAARDSNSSSSSISSSSSGVPADLLLLLPECDSSRPSSVTEEEARRAINAANKRSNYFSNIANRFSSVFLTRGGSKKDASFGNGIDVVDFQMSTPGGKRMNSSAKQVIKKYVKKVKPLYEKLSSSSSSSQKNQNQSQSQSQNQNQNQNQNAQPQKKKTFSFSIRRESMKKQDEDGVRGIYSHSHSFSGNLRFPRRKKCAGSCPSSMRSSPTHSGLLTIGGGGSSSTNSRTPVSSSSLSSSLSSMEELQSAIQGAIAHCKSTMAQSNQRKILDVSTIGHND